MRYLIIIISMAVLSSCCKEEHTKLGVSNKIKRLKYVFYQHTEDTAIFDFHYDSTGFIYDVKAYNNYDSIGSHINFTILNDSTLEISYKDAMGLPIPNVLNYYAHLNQKNRILSLDHTDFYYDWRDPNTYFAIYNTISKDADTIYHPNYFYFIDGYYAFSNISSFDFRFYNGNCINHKLASTDVFNGNQNNPTFDTFSIDMSYNTSLKNNNLLPMQNSFLDLYDYNGSISLFYFLSLNGYYYIQPNANLLQTKQTIDLGGFYHTTYYEYKTDANENVTEMCVRHYSTLDSCDKYFFEYY